MTGLKSHQVTKHKNGEDGKVRAGDKTKGVVKRGANREAGRPGAAAFMNNKPFLEQV